MSIGSVLRSGFRFPRGWGTWASAGLGVVALGAIAGVAAHFIYQRHRQYVGGEFPSDFDPNYSDDSTSESDRLAKVPVHGGPQSDASPSSAIASAVPFSLGAPYRGPAQRRPTSAGPDHLPIVEPDLVEGPSPIVEPLLPAMPGPVATSDSPVESIPSAEPEPVVASESSDELESAGCDSSDYATAESETESQFDPRSKLEGLQLDTNSEAYGYMEDAVTDFEQTFPGDVKYLLGALRRYRKTVGLVEPSGEKSFDGLIEHVEEECTKSERQRRSGPTTQIAS